MHHRLSVWYNFFGLAPSQFHEINLIEFPYMPHTICPSTLHWFRVVFLYPILVTLLPPTSCQKTKQPRFVEIQYQSRVVSSLKMRGGSCRDP